MTLKYRLHILGWYNFEILVQTLLKVIIGPGVSSFGGSKDGGRDAYFHGKASFPNINTSWDGTWTFQVKFHDVEFNETDIKNRLLSSFSKEIENIKRKRENWPNNYILITNNHVGVSTRKKLEDTIRNNGFQGNFHIIDGKEICEFLDIYPEIRRTFPQLIGLADIEQVFNKDIYFRSEAFLSDMQPRLINFVVTEDYLKALKVINKYNFVLLDGAPECGKSFTGSAITLVFAMDSFDIYCVRSPQDILKIYDSKGKQIFFADDAVGSISYDPSLGLGWSQELHLILGKLDSKHKLIWTARSYILEEALAKTKLTENIDNFPNKNEVLVEVGNLSDKMRALILYNHAKNSKLLKLEKELIKENVIKIINKKYFTPERIRQLINLVIPELRQQGYLDRKIEWIIKIIEFLKNPSERFCKAFNEGLNTSEKTLLLAMLDLGDKVKIKDLKEEYERRISNF